MSQFADPLYSTLRSHRSPRDLATSLVFLHELSHPAWPTGPTPGCSWSDLRRGDPMTLTERIAAALKAEEARFPEQLDGIFEHSSPEAVTVSELDQAMNVVEILSGQMDSRAAAGVPFSGHGDFLGTVHEGASSKWSKQATGEFFTPGSLAGLLAAMCPANPGDWVYEPTAGAGHLLLASIEASRRELGDTLATSITYVAIELSSSARLCRMNLVLAGAADQAVVFRANALTSAIVGRDRDSGQLRKLQFSCILANPPFGKVPKGTLEEEITVLEVPGRLLNRRIPMPPTSEILDTPEEEAPVGCR